MRFGNCNSIKHNKSKKRVPSYFIQSYYLDRMLTCYISAAEVSRIYRYQGAASRLLPGMVCSCSQTYNEISITSIILVLHLKYNGPRGHRIARVRILALPYRYGYRESSCAGWLPQAVIFGSVFVKTPQEAVPTHTSFHLRDRCEGAICTIKNGTQAHTRYKVFSSRHRLPDFSFTPTA